MTSVNNELLINRGYTMLNPLAEALALTTNSDDRNIILGALDLRGPVNLEALRKTVGCIGDMFPQLRAFLQQVRVGGRYYLTWDHRSCLQIRLLFWDVSRMHVSGPGLDILLNSLDSSLMTERDLFEEPPIEFHLVKLEQNHHLLACIMAHVAGDAITLAEIVKEFMAKYHELVMGDKPTFSYNTVSVSTGQKRAVRKKNTLFPDYWKTLRQALIPYAKPSLPVGVGISGNSGEHYIKRLFSVEETEGIVSNAGKNRVPFVDYLMAGVTLGIDRWNAARNVTSAMVSAALTVNMQGRFIEGDGLNNDSVLYFEFSQEQRRNAEKLPLLVYRLRTKQFRDQMDLKYSKGMAKLNNFLNIFPFKIRQQAYLKILQRHQTSFALGFMGVLWPESDGRRISGDSYLTSAGGLNITEAHAMAYRIVSGTPLYLSAYFFRKRLNLILSAAAWKFTRDEAQAFLDLVVAILERQQPEGNHFRIHNVIN